MLQQAKNPAVLKSANTERFGGSKRGLYERFGHCCTPVRERGPTYRAALLRTSVKPVENPTKRPARDILLRGGRQDMKYAVALTRTDEGFSVSCPGLPGCWSQGRTEEEALSNIRDAIQEYLDVAKQLAGERDLRVVEIPA